MQFAEPPGFDSQLRPYPATFLGSSEITLAELALAYTIFPNGGWRPNAPHILERIEEKDGTCLAAHEDTAAESRSNRKPPTKFIPAWSMRWNRARDRRPTRQFGLKKFPAAGKTGTAYDFTDALFAGYDSAITCAVWAGFDKPQKIYRGAFGSEIALPVWVDVMNASIERVSAERNSRSRRACRSRDLLESGLLATDKCYEDVKKASGASLGAAPAITSWRPTEQMPADACDVHTDSVRTQLVKKFDNSEWPRAALAVDTAEVERPVVEAQGPTLLGETIPT